MSGMFQVTVNSGNKSVCVQAQAGERLMEAIERAGVTLSAPCGGRCFCGKCGVRVQGETGEIHSAERKFLSEEQIASGHRLACAAHVMSDLTVWAQDVGDQAEILSTGGQGELKRIHPSVRLIPVQVEAATLQNQQSDAERLLKALNLPEAHLSRRVLASLPDKLRGEEALGAVVFQDREVLDLCSLKRGGFGVAVDIGTTTMVAYLMDLLTGEQLEVESMLNPQRPHGADVISRTDYTIDRPEGLKQMSELVCSAIESMTRTMLKRRGLDENSVYHILCVGNTIMMHLLCALPARYIAMTPFVPAYARSFSLPAAELGMKLKNAMLTAAPCVAGYIGADTLGAVLSCDMDQKDGVALMIDIGTNGEIVLGGKNRMVCCSAAAGPAFEGAHIQCGTGGVPGAVDSVKIEDGTMRVTTIGGQAAQGICGSGLVDAVSEMKDQEIMDMTGRIDEDEMPEEYESRCFDLDGKPAFSLTGQGEDGVFIAQKDLREVQLAKGAIAAGIEVLMNQLGVEFKDIEALYLAGGFGNYIDKHSACNIGLLPPELEERIVPIGNGAGAGAQRMLLDEDYLKRAEEIRRRMEYIELSARPDFQDLFVDHMLFE